MTVKQDDKPSFDDLWSIIDTLKEKQGALSLRCELSTENGHSVLGLMQVVTQRSTIGCHLDLTDKQFVEQEEVRA